MSSLELIRTIEAGAPSCPPGPLLEVDGLPPEIIRLHAAEGSVADIALYHAKNFQYGGAGLLMVDGELFVDPAFNPDYLASSCKRQVQAGNPIWTRGMFGSVNTLRIAGPVYAPLHPNMVYGHFLLEMLSKLMIIRSLYNEGMRHPIAVSKANPQWVTAFLHLVIPDANLIYFDPDTTVIKADAFLLITRVDRDAHLHPSLAERFRMIAGLAGSSSDAGDKIYLSRAKLSKNLSWHWIEDEAKIERLFAERGFRVIYPEKLSIVEQIKLFKRTNILAGEFSSAMHNALFMPKGSRVFCLNWINVYQSRIAALKQQAVCFVPDRDGAFHDWRSHGSQGIAMHFDPTRVGRELDKFIEEFSVNTAA
ncbi:DUF563 domain-containing protein [Microvirga aerilata]|uniref:DUF563 domain-containing protein n=1 Tax=Microvirga aerilata TaxID=670292 RepID=A0A937D3E6_9HYPH|nr:glycosyltransferase 61 family protein [Microvirga aerilata]MBL0406320.1 DUF563 domain-containing protein [Microvirga aerilata]